MHQSIKPFVESSANDLGIGKLIDCKEELCLVTYFRSPAEKHFLEMTVPKASLKRIKLVSETRVYQHDEGENSWEVGRVLAYIAEDDKYFVGFPNGKKRLVSSDDLQVRCRLPITSPIDHLAFQLNETAFWNQARSEFVRHLLEQHGSNHGLSALVSASVELVPHQASVVHRVLHDPFQRYLLADEVGLGKTIEAGALIRQFTLDEPKDHQTIVIVLDSLVTQWNQELTHRFHLGPLIGKSIHLVSLQNRSELTKLLKTSRMIVIDEAHHLCSWAWSSDLNENAIFKIVKTAAESLDKRILLLSATPVLHNEQSFLAMLHLLDPQVYQLNDLDSFKERVRLRQEIAERLVDLREDESNFFLGDSLNALGDLLNKDQEFMIKQRKLTELIQKDVAENDLRRINLIRSIRSHVSDMWRLHRRILRNRRNGSTSAYLPGRGGVTNAIYDCENEQELAEAVDAWRLTISAALYSAESKEKNKATAIAKKMEELAVCEPFSIPAFAIQRLNGQIREGMGTLSLCEGEIESLQRIIRSAAECNHNAKLNKLLDLVKTEISARSFVVFANSKNTADQIFLFLTSKLTFGRVLRHSTSNLAWTQFKSEKRGYILVCDNTAEEGLNLQKRIVVAIHYDLPFSPNRIEQRMGRLDRFGTGKSIESLVLTCRGSPVQQSWFKLLSRGLSVFDRSVASLQYVIEETMQKLWNQFLDSGNDAIQECCDALGGEKGIVETEFKRIRAQDEIDSYDTESFSHDIAEKIQDQDFDLSRTSPGIFHNWVVRNLQFSQRGEEGKSDKVFSFEFNRRDDSGKWRKPGCDTLVPSDEFQRLFKDSIDDDQVANGQNLFSTVPFSFDRVVAQKRSCRLLRIGDPFVDAFETFTRWDDRGVCYAFWRFMADYECEGHPELFFRFDYVVSPDPYPFDELCKNNVGASKKAMYRRSMAIMRPQFVSIWLDADYELVKDERRLNLLMPEYNKNNTLEKKDINLNRDRWRLVSKFYDLSLWRDRCFAARERSEKILREQTNLQEWSEKCVDQAEKSAILVQQQYHTRLALAVGNSRISLENEMIFEKDYLDAQITSFRNPKIYVDSVGAVFVSNQIPFVDTLKDREDSD
jgi:ATP-dependent helicase HepA